jgi:high-affinity iron transporter
MSMIRIALQAEPPRAEQAEQESQALIRLLGDYRDGKLLEEPVTSEKLTIADMLAILDKASKDIASGHYAEADGQMKAFITSWPLVEGQVSIRSAEAYSKIELQMTEVSRYLLANPPAPQQAEDAISVIRTLLQPLTLDTTYTAWDAGAILLREGLEALLVIAALLAYLKRTGNADKTGWIWSGAAAGLLLSIGVAILLTSLIAQAAAGSAREAMEGVTGLVSVFLMLGVGSWLHSKSNLRSWSSYIDGQMGNALAKGSLWSLFLVSGLAILREGAETTIFYAGMASSIAPGQLALGITVTSALLVLIGYAMIRFSAKLPIRPFFLLASALIYYLAIRFVGESLHSLQVAGWLPSHLSDTLPTLSLLGVYPTWETTLPQLLVLLVVLLRFVWVRLARQQATPSA